MPMNMPSPTSAPSPSANIGSSPSAAPRPRGELIAKPTPSPTGPQSSPQLATKPHLAVDLTQLSALPSLFATSSEWEVNPFVEAFGNESRAHETVILSSPEVAASTSVEADADADAPLPKRVRFSTPSSSNTAARVNSTPAPTASVPFRPMASMPTLPAIDTILPGITGPQGLAALSSALASTQQETVLLQRALRRSANALRTLEGLKIQSFVISGAVRLRIDAMTEAIERRRTMEVRYRETKVRYEAAMMIKEQYPAMEPSASSAPVTQVAQAAMVGPTESTTATAHEKERELMEPIPIFTDESDHQQKDATTVATTAQSSISPRVLGPSNSNGSIGSAGSNTSSPNSPNNPNVCVSRPSARQKENILRNAGSDDSPARNTRSNALAKTPPALNTRSKRVISGAAGAAVGGARALAAAISRGWTRA